MRRSPLVLLALLLAACEPRPISIPTTPVLPPPDRPGLMLDAADLPAIRARLGRAPYSDWWATVRALADAAAAGTPGSPALSEAARARWAKAAAFAAVVDEEPAHLAAARAALLAVGTGPDTTISDLGPNAGPTSRTVLTASSHLQAVCQAYDLVRDQLSGADRTDVEARLALAAQRVAASSAAKPDVLLFRVNNWRTKAVSSLGIAALALPASTVSPKGDTPARWLGVALAGVNQVLGRVIAPGGWNAEGAWYTTYSLGNLHPFLVAYRRTTGRNLFPYLEPLFAHALRMRQPNGREPAFEDSLEVELPWQVLAPFLVTPGPYHDAWLAGSDGPASATASNWANDDVKEVDEIVFHDDALVPESTTPGTWVDVASGVARLASADAPETTVAYVNGAVDYFDSWAGGGHSHVDPLGLIVYAQGEALLVDAGYGPTGFSSVNRPWYVSAEAHNTATLDGQAPFLVAPATTLSHVAAGAAGSAVALRAPFGVVASPWSDLFEPIDVPAGSFERAVVVLDARTVVVTDVVSADEPRTLALLWHGRGTRVVLAGGAAGAEVTWSRARSGAPDTHVRLVSAASAPISVVQSSGLLSPEWTQEEPLHYVRLERPAETQLRVLTLLDLDGPAAPARAISRPFATGGEALVVADGAAEETLLSGDGATPTAADGVSAVARFARVRRVGGDVVAALVDRGRSVAVNGTTVLSASATFTGALARDGSMVRLSLGTIAAAPLALHVALGGAPPLAVSWQGLPLAFTLAGGGAIDLVAPGPGEIVLWY